MRKNFVLVVIVLAACFAGVNRASAEPMAALVGQHRSESEEQLSSWSSAPADLVIPQMEVFFAIRNREAFQRLGEAQQDPSSPQYHKWLTHEELLNKFGPTQDEVNAVVVWLQQQGFQVTKADRNVIWFTGSVGVAEQAFGVRMLVSPDSTKHCNIDDPQIPARFAEIVSSIAGLDNLGVVFRADQSHTSPPAASKKPAPTTVRPKSEGPAGRLQLAQASDVPFFLAGGNHLGFGVADMRTFYSESPLIAVGINGSPTASTECIALIEASDFSPAGVTINPSNPGVNIFDSTFSLTSPALTKIFADSPPAPIDPTLVIEDLVDIEWAQATAPSGTLGQRIVVYIGNPANGSVSIVDALHSAVNDNTCGAISISLSTCGQPSTFYSSQLDSLFAQAVRQGQSVFVATGDIGAAALVPSGSTCVVGSSQGVNEIAADPNVMAVGGTQSAANFDPVTNADIGYVPEQVWNDTHLVNPAPPFGATGGGTSAIFGKPNYQSGPGVPSGTMRVLPDASLAASSQPQLNAGYYWGDDAGTLLCCEGGTSIATPIWAGISKLIAQKEAGRVGNTNPQLYKLGGLAWAAGLRDVTTGDNGFNGVAGFPAGLAFDQSTGWGTPDITTFVNSFSFSRGLVASGIKGSNTTITSAEIYTPTSRTVGTFSPGGTFVDSRTSYGVSPLPDGTILVFGGVLNGTVTKSAGIYDPALGKFTLLSATMPQKREVFIYTTLLFTGKVFITGRDDVGQDISTVLYDPVAKTFASGPNQIAPPSGINAGHYTQTLLGDGRVLIQGGTAVSQLYDPILNSFTKTVGQPKIANRIVASSVLLPDGRVLITGGDIGITPTATAEVYTPPPPGSSNDFYTQVGDMTEARPSPNILVINTGKVLVMGSDKNVDLFDPSANTFSATGQMQVARGAYGFSRLNNGTVLVAGGLTPSQNIASAEIYDPVTGTFTLTANMATARNSPFDFAIK